MNKKHAVVVLSSVALLGLFAGCGGAGGGDATPNSVVSCSSGTTTVSSGQTVTPADASTVLTYSLDSSGNQTVCVVSGSATISG